MKKVKYIILLIIYMLLSASLSSMFKMFGIIPNLNLIIVVLVGLMSNNIWGLYTGLIVGLFQDIIFSEIIGINALIYMFIGYLSYRISRKINAENTTFAVFTIAISSLLYSIYIYVYEQIFNSMDGLFVKFIGTYIPEMIYTAIFGIIVLKIKDYASKYIIF